MATVSKRRCDRRVGLQEEVGLPLARVRVHRKEPVSRARNSVPFNGNFRALGFRFSKIVVEESQFCPLQYGFSENPIEERGFSRWRAQKQKNKNRHMPMVYMMKNKLIVLGTFIGFYLVHLLLLFSTPTFNVWFMSYGKTELSRYVTILLPNWTAIARYVWCAWTSWIVVCIVGTPCLGMSILYEGLIK